MAKKNSMDQRKEMLSFIRENRCLFTNRFGGPNGSQGKERLWAELAERLNSFATGATKDKKQWQKSWVDWKCATKAKAQEIRAYAAGTGGGGACPKQLTGLEEELMGLIGWQSAEGHQEVIDPLEGGDVVAPRGWPFSLGSSGVALQLGELDPTLLRNRDCYLCVRRGCSEDSSVQVALVWKCGALLSSRGLLVKSSSLETPLSVEMAATDEGLPGLLQSLLVSVERAIERVPLDDLAFPCPQCRDDEDDGVVCGCQCVCQPQVQVEKKDTSIQTSPMFEFVGSIPHIDSDEENDMDFPDGTTTILHVRRDSVIKHEEEELVTPKSITELPEKLLTSGIHLPGTCDVNGCPVVVYDVSCVVKASSDSHQIASLLLYYASLQSADKLKDGFTVLILSGNGEGTAVEILDISLSLVTPRVKIGSVFLWRPSPLYSDRWQRNNNVLEISKLKCQIVTDEMELHRYITEENAPPTCGGRANHDQLEWIEFHKEVEPFLTQCHACGRRLVSIMSDLRASDGQSQISRRQLHHQHRALNRALNDTDLQRLRREGNGTLTRLEERAQWLPASEDVRLSLERARRLFQEVDRAARRLEQLAEGRRERLRDLARVRALEDETAQHTELFDMANYNCG